MMSPAKIGLASNESKTGGSFTRTDAASHDALFLCDSDFPTLMFDTEGIRIMCTNISSAAQQLWAMRLQDTERSESRINPHGLCEVNQEQRVSRLTKWVKSEFPVFLTWECEQPGGTAATGKQMFGYPGVQMDVAMCNTVTGTKFNFNFRASWKTMLNGFRYLISDAEWPTQDPRELLMTERMRPTLQQRWSQTI